MAMHASLNYGYSIIWYIIQILYRNACQILWTCMVKPDSTGKVSMVMYNHEYSSHTRLNDALTMHTGKIMSDLMLSEV